MEHRPAEGQQWQPAPDEHFTGLAAVRRTQYPDLVELVDDAGQALGRQCVEPCSADHAVVDPLGVCEEPDPIAVGVAPCRSAAWLEPGGARDDLEKAAGASALAELANRLVEEGTRGRRDHRVACRFPASVVGVGPGSASAGIGCATKKSHMRSVALISCVAPVAPGHVCPPPSTT